MGVDTEKYIRKPLYVDAVRVTAQNFNDCVEWSMGEMELEERPGGDMRKFIKVRVHNPKNPRQTKAFIGDWLLYTDRGFKVYTNKAFRQAFDLVTEDNAQLSHPETPEPPGIPPTPPDEELEFVEATPEAIADAVNEQQPPDEPVSDPVVNEQSQVLEPATGVPTPAATPPAEEARLQTETGADRKLKHEPVEPQSEPVSEQAPEDAAAGKRVLSEEEQRQMGPDAVREAVRTGEVILAQDLAESA